ncbi:PTS sugar transporter subunit IIA [Lactococcus petauri]|uniref:PTS sugar transporter subunit IIA n=1 Tax=Lactococcus petauri TaxID=1940789 RepID=UPI001F56FEBA|nr:PTS sugar transporter subunit IIA [Lactococcus petauri]
MKIVVTGHGCFSSGIKSTISLLAGEIQKIHYIDFLEEMSEKDLKKKFVDIIDEASNGVVFFCDLFGGTPYKQAAVLSTEYPNVAVVAGCNVGALLEVSLQSIDEAQKVSELLIEATMKGVRKFGKQRIAQEEVSDGI